MKIVEIKTPNCSHCKAIEPELNELKSKHPDIEFKEYVFSVDKEAQTYMVEYSIKSAPTFVIDDNKAVKFEELKEILG